MEKKEFKTIIHTCLLLNGFVKKGHFYYIESPEIICSVGCQASNFSNAYFINAGIFIKALDNNCILPRDVDGHIRCRGEFTAENNKTDYIYLDIASKSSITKGVEELIVNTLTPSLTLTGLKKVLKEQPVLLYQTSMKAKKHLEIS